jgi:hypothetical protein
MFVNALACTLAVFFFLADPLSMSPQKALETIGANLQKQYERWQPRARYKQSLDPTVEEVKKLCTSLRRNAKEERVLFHYNGHGVPKPTSNGEVWVFNRVSMHITSYGYTVSHIDVTNYNASFSKANLEVLNNHTLRKGTV